MQLHQLDLKQGGDIVAERVPVIAIRVPQRLAIDWVAQAQPVWADHTVVELSFADLLARVPPAEVGTIRVHSIPGVPLHYVGRDAAGQPCILLGSPIGRMRAPVRLAAIEVSFCIACRISPLDGDAREEVLTVVKCTSAETQVQGYFLHVCETIVRILGPTPSQANVVNVVARLIDLFQRLTDAPVVAVSLRPHR